MYNQIRIQEITGTSYSVKCFQSSNIYINDSNSSLITSREVSLEEIDGNK